MGRAKDIVVRPIASADARRIVETLHYSHKTVPNSQVHLGVFLDGECGGALQFGPPINSVHMHKLVKGTQRREYLELNRMALADWLPRNGESRALRVSLLLLRRNYPHLKWVVSFADGCSCGDGAIYRAAGFVLTDIKRNVELRRDPLTGEVKHGIRAWHEKRKHEFKDWPKLEGYQFRYLYFLHPEERANLAVPEIPFERIDELGVGMYRGQARPARPRSIDADAPTPPGRGGDLASHPRAPGAACDCPGAVHGPAAAAAFDPSVYDCARCGHGNLMHDGPGGACTASADARTSLVVS